MRIRTFIKSNFWLLLVVLATIVHLGISLKLAIYWYDTFNLGKFDLGNAVQVVHNTLHGKFFTYTDRFGTQISRLSEHADFILLLLVPFFSIFPSPLTLIVAQCLALSLGGFLIYLIGREINLSKAASFFIALAYFLNPDVGYLSLDAFHGITFAIPFVLLVFYFLERYAKAATNPNLWGVLIPAFLVLISKEEASLLIALLGFYTIIFLRRKRLGLFLSAIGLLWFAGYFFVVSPAYGPVREASITSFAKNFPTLVPEGFQSGIVRENLFISRYSHLGASFKEILLSPILKTHLVIQAVSNSGYLLRLFAPLGFLPLFAPMALLPALPEYLINTLSGGAIMTQKHYGVFHYISLLVPVLFYAVLLGVRRVGRFVDRRVLPFIPSRIAEGLASFFVFSCAVFFSLKEHNPLLVNPINIVSQRLTPVLRESLANYPRFSKLFLAEKILPAAEPTPVAPSLPISPSGAETTVAIPTPPPTVFARNPKQSGGNQAVYELLRNKAGAVSGPSSLGAKLVVRENYNLFPLHWQESRFVAADFTGAPKTFGSIGVALGGGVDAKVAEFLRNSVWEIEANPSSGVIYSGDGLLVFEQGRGRELFERLSPLELKEPLSSTRGVILHHLAFPTEVRRGETTPFEIGWDLEKDYVASEVLEVVPFLALVREGSQVASFYDVIYGLFLLVDRATGPQHVRQLIKVPETVPPGEYRLFVGWYEPTSYEMLGHAKLKDTLKLGMVEIK